MRRPVESVVRLTLAMTLALSGCAAAQEAPRLTGVRIETAFVLPGANAGGVVVSVRIDKPNGHATSDDFVLVLFDGNGRRDGSLACIATRFLDGDDARPPWILLDGPAGTLARSYRTLVASNAAVVGKTRKALERPGRYEFVYWVGSTYKKAALAFGDDLVHRPLDVERGLIGSFTVPWP